MNSTPSESKRSIIARAISSFETFSSWCDEVWIKINRLTETNYELGFALAQQGRIDDAIWRFRITLWLAPNHEPTLYNLACLYHHKGESQKALSLFTRLVRSNPSHVNALYMIAAIDPTLLKAELRPTSVPLSQLIEYFDHYAAFYDAEQVQRNYRLPAILHQLLRPMLEVDVARENLLDIGCGTGLVGATFREEFANIIGVDLSNEMLKVAYKRMDRRGVRIYNDLIHQDIRTYLAQEKLPHFNVIIALDVLPYLGDLALLARQMAAALRQGGIIALSFVPYDQSRGYGVMPRTGYFGHSLAYVEQTMLEAGLHMLRRGEVEARSNQPMQLCFFGTQPLQADDDLPNAQTSQPR